jgi:hypothetical protein
MMRFASLAALFSGAVACSHESLPACISSCTANNPTVGTPAEECFAACSSSCDAPSKVLFIGNSFTFWNNGQDRHVQNLAQAAGYNVTTDATTQGGATLSVHWRNTNAVRDIQRGNYDVVIIQEDMPELCYGNRCDPSSDIDDFYQYARLFADEIRDSGATPMFYMTWPFDRLDWLSMDDIADAHEKMGSELNMVSAPVGLSWDLAEQQYPGRWNMYDRDNEHQSWVGTYIGACGLFSQLFGESCEGNSYIPNNSGISGSEAADLQELSWAAARNWNYKRGN